MEVDEFLKTWDDVTQVMEERLVSVEACVDKGDP